MTRKKPDKREQKRIDKRNREEEVHTFLTAVNTRARECSGVHDVCMLHSEEESQRAKVIFELSYGRSLRDAAETVSDILNDTEFL